VRSAVNAAADSRANRFVVLKSPNKTAKGTDVRVFVFVLYHVDCDYYD